MGKVEFKYDIGDKCWIPVWRWRKHENGGTIEQILVDRIPAVVVGRMQNLLPDGVSIIDHPYPNGRLTISYLLLSDEVGSKTGCWLTEEWMEVRS